MQAAFPLLTISTLHQFRGGTVGIKQRLSCHQPLCPYPCRRPSLSALLAPLSHCRTVDSRGLPPAAAASCSSHIDVFDTTTCSSVVNLCPLAHSILRRRALFGAVLVSFTVVQALHSGHFIGAIYLAFGWLLPLCARFLCLALPPPAPTSAFPLARLPVPSL
jgi:hypothetical protein